MTIVFQNHFYIPWVITEHIIDNGIDVITQPETSYSGHKGWKSPSASSWDLKGYK